MRILRSCYVNLSKKWFLLGWFICHSLLHCDQAIGVSEENIKSESCSRTAYVGSSVFQGMTTCRVDIDPRGLAASVVTAGLLGSGPSIDPKASFASALATNLTYEVCTLLIWGKFVDPQVEAESISAPRQQLVADILKR